MSRADIALAKRSPPAQGPIRRVIPRQARNSDKAPRVRRPFPAPEATKVCSSVTRSGPRYRGWRVTAPLAIAS
jgi:hypothetical protein